MTDQEIYEIFKARGGDMLGLTMTGADKTRFQLEGYFGNYSLLKHNLGPAILDTIGRELWRPGWLTIGNGEADATRTTITGVQAVTSLTIRGAVAKALTEARR